MRTRSIIAGGLIVIGVVWIGQGTGVIRGSSFMTDDIRWAVIGLVLLVAGVGLGAATVIRRSKA